MVCVLSRLAIIEAFVSLRSGACQPGIQVGDLIVTEPDGSARPKIPDRASRIECTRTPSCPCEDKSATAELLGRGACRAYGTQLAFWWQKHGQNRVTMASSRSETIYKSASTARHCLGCVSCAILGWGSMSALSSKGPARFS